MKKLEEISITVNYTDDDGDPQCYVKRSGTFESAEEDLGKLERLMQLP